MSASLDEKAFRNHAYEVALAQLAPMLAEFQGRLGNDLRFDPEAVYTLRRHLAQTLKAFIDHTPVQAVSPEFAELTRGLKHGLEHRKMQVDSERSFLEEEAGLARMPIGCNKGD